MAKKKKPEFETIHSLEKEKNKLYISGLNPKISNQKKQRIIELYFNGNDKRLLTIAKEVKSNPNMVSNVIQEQFNKREMNLQDKKIQLVNELKSLTEFWKICEIEDKDKISREIILMEDRLFYISKLSDYELGSEICEEICIFKSVIN